MELHERRRRILAAVVDDYVATAEPVGSEALARKHDFGVKSATIRNELAAMSEMGYLRQPHTSAGRVPSDLGYRYYVDELMPQPTLPLEDSYLAKQSYDPHETEVEEILQQTCRILAGLTQYISLVTPPRVDVVTISQVALLAVKPGKLLVITVFSTGHIDHRALDYSGNLSHANTVSLGNLVNARYHGADMNTFALRTDKELPSEMRLLEGLYQKITAVIKQALTSITETDLYVEGTSNMLKQPEFEQSEKASGIFETLARRRVVFQVLGSTLLGNGVTLVIGSENNFQEMQECSFVASSYSINGRPCGSVGVIGPTRMNYRQAVAAVRFMAHNLSELLSSLSID
ncbi:MAG TPA: heat-inducible transcriptional repressor HrcA [Armatimonadota bacterium]|jgi:heat-inducible transcriptional repressor